MSTAVFSVNLHQLMTFSDKLSGRNRRSLLQAMNTLKFNTAEQVKQSIIHVC